MEEIRIKFLSSMDRCCGFSIPKNGRFYVVSIDNLIFLISTVPRMK